MTQRLRYTTFRAENEEKVELNDHEIICTLSLNLNLRKITFCKYPC